MTNFEFCFYNGSKYLSTIHEPFIFFAINKVLTPTIAYISIFKKGQKRSYGVFWHHTLVNTLCICKTSSTWEILIYWGVTSFALFAFLVNTFNCSALYYFFEDLIKYLFISIYIITRYFLESFQLSTLLYVFWRKCFCYFLEI